MVKPIGCKWVYKRKRRANKKVKTFKVKLVAKGYGQKLGFDYEKTFSLVSMLKSMDVKNAFLNVNFNENIYMMQLDVFIENG